MKQTVVIFILAVYILLMSCSPNQTTSEQTDVTVHSSAAPTSNARATFETAINNRMNSCLRMSGESYCLTGYHGDSGLVTYYNGWHLASYPVSVAELADLDGDGKKDSVFILPAIDPCEEGESYYFLGAMVPRLQTDSPCCHMRNIFDIGDIDEDGKHEIGLFYSSCASRYKSLVTLTLRQDQWKEVGSVIFDLNYSSYDADYRTYVRKVRKGRLQMLEITDLTDNYANIGKRNWLTFDMPTD